MDTAPYAKCSCRACGTHLEFPSGLAGSDIHCPHCQQSTTLEIDPALAPATEAAALAPEPAIDSALAPSPQSQPGPRLTVAEALTFFQGQVPKTKVSFLYQLGMVIVALAMVLLPLVYLVMIGLTGWLVYFWATHFTFLLSAGRGRTWLVLVMAYIAPLFAGCVLLFFMVKPLFARRAPHAQPLALNPGAEPLLFAFIAKLCKTVGAPHPTRIDIDCQLNAAASFRRGTLSFLGNDLVLTIGLPLVAGLNLREFAGVIAHEFGHFSQGFGMRLTYVIRTVNHWFARLVYERDTWDLALEEWGQTEDGHLAIVVGVARLAVWFSRLLLKLLMWIGHGIGCFMLRQMEYDADSYEIKFAGSEAFESAMRRFHVLGAALQKTYKELRVPWNLNRRLPDDFPSYFLQRFAALTPAERTRLEDTMGLEPSGLFDTHPSYGDRIRRARQAGEPGVFHGHGPATQLFSCFDVVCKQVTLLHYADDLQLPLALAKLVPVEEHKAAPVDPVSPLQGNNSPTNAASEPPPASKGRIRVKIPGAQNE